MDPRAALPPVDRLLAHAGLAPVLERYRRRVVVTLLRDELEAARERLARGAGAPDADEIIRRCVNRVASLESPRPRRVINATGVVVHTNLGRAPIARSTAQATALVASSYSTLEYDLGPGRRGQRSSHVADLLRLLFPGKDALVVNNNAAAVLLALNTMALGKEVVISRGELIEIGGSFRIPEVLERAGGRLAEVGTTNRTHERDYLAALGPETGMILKVWPSNYRVVGFTKGVELSRLVELGHERGLPVVADQGCGRLFRDSAGPASEPSVEELLETDADLVCFSGDKMLGGPQAGLLVGDPRWVERCAKNPLTRALRPDKMTLAALAATCQAWLRKDVDALVPAARMLDRPPRQIRGAAQRLAASLRRHLPDADVRTMAGSSRVGGGAAPEEELPTTLVSLALSGTDEEKLARRLRKGDPPVVVRTAERQILLDPRTLLDGEAREVVAAIAAAVADLRAEG